MNNLKKIWLGDGCSGRKARRAVKEKLRSSAKRETNRMLDKIYED